MLLILALAQSGPGWLHCHRSPALAPRTMAAASELHRQENPAAPAGEHRHCGVPPESCQTPNGALVADRSVLPGRAKFLTVGPRTMGILWRRGLRYGPP